MFDIIGDVHGHADKLEQLLDKLGYSGVDGVWSHPERTLVSVGDLVDRGPQQRKVIDILRPMSQRGEAIVLMGNHEFNAVSWYLRDKAGEPLRAHTDKNRAQHAAFLAEAEADMVWYEQTIAWFMSLPLLVEHDTFCCVHAAWDPEHIHVLKKCLRQDMSLEPAYWEAANTTGHPLYDAIEVCLKGPEIALLDGFTFKDGGGHSRTKIRLKWWAIDEQATYQNSAVSVPDPSLLPDLPLPDILRSRALPDKPCFFGHYWMLGTPKLLSPSVACLDWSVVRTDGHMVGYQFDGESTLEPSKLVWA